MSQTYSNVHDCGGTIYSGGGSPEEDHDVCDLCGAFLYASAAAEGWSFPTGTNPADNRAAWDNQEDRSPDAAEPESCED